MATFAELLQACAPSDEQRKRASVRYTFAADSETGEKPSFSARGVVAEGTSPDAIASAFRGREIRLAGRSAYTNGDSGASQLPVSGTKAAALILQRHGQEEPAPRPRNRLAKEPVANGPTTQQAA
jgi:hypothetical protein